MRETHGKCKVLVVDNIIICVLNDSFNMEKVHCYAGKIKAILSYLRKKNLVVLLMHLRR